MNRRKDGLPVLDVVELTNHPRCVTSAKNAFVLSSVAMPVGTMKPARPPGANQLRESLRKQRVGIHVTERARQRVASRIVGEQAGRLGIAAGDEKVGVQCLLGDVGRHEPCAASISG